MAPSPYQAFYTLENYFWTQLSDQKHVFSEDVFAYRCPVAGFNFLYAHENARVADIQQAAQFFAQEDYQLIVHEAVPLTLLNAEIAVAMVQKVPIILPERVDDFEVQIGDLSTWAMPLVSAFGTSESGAMQYRAVHEKAVQQHAAMTHFTLLRHSEAVCSLTMTQQDNIVRFDDIGTASVWQGKGYATALIQYVSAYVRTRGVTEIYLEASTAGASMYQKLGFVPLFQYRCYQGENPLPV